ncbi:MAG: hypothetical protein WAX07_04870 [Candidatus Altiarchaeia archaeon]
MKNKGAMFYTLIGLVVIIMIAIFVIHVNNITYSPALANEAEQDRFNNAIYDLHSQIPEYARRAAYPAVWKVGHKIGSDGVNVYLNGSREAGRAKLKDDLMEGFIESLNQEMCTSAKNCTPEKYVYTENNIPLTVYRVEKENVTMTPTETGLSFNLTLHMSAEYKTHYYEEVRTISADVPTRIFQMFEKAKNFTDSYENDVQTANTLALYARGIGNAYLACNGTLINQGHLTYDPVDTFIRGNRETLQELAENPGDAIDLGAVPAATWVDETMFLTEPSYVPTGADIGNGIPIDLIKKTLTNRFDVKNKMDEVCRTLDNQTQVDECLDNNDPDKLAETYQALISEQERITAVIGEIDDWKTYANTGTDCDTFKKRTKETIQKK